MSDVVCTSCGFVGEPKAITRGSFWIEVILWLCFIIPGLIYSLWRLSSRHDGCPSCGQTTLIPATSPMATKFLRENLPELQIKSETRVPSKAAYGAGKALGRVVGSLLRK
jgi:hypothetical protein